MCKKNLQVCKNLQSTIQSNLIDCKYNFKLHFICKKNYKLAKLSIERHLQILT